MLLRQIGHSPTIYRSFLLELEVGREVAWLKPIAAAKNQILNEGYGSINRKTTKILHPNNDKRRRHHQESLLLLNTQEMVIHRLRVETFKYVTPILVEYHQSQANVSCTITSDEWKDRRNKNIKNLLFLDQKAQCS